MKFNMKKPDKDYDRIEVTDWFEGFEKELRKILDAENQNYDTVEAMKDCGEREELLAYSRGKIKILKHILGEFKL